MANVFAITISAVDRATATVRKINNSFSKLTRPVNQLQKSIKALGRELGIDKLARSLGNVARRARDAASEVAKIGAPLLALIGGGSLVGIAALATQWARLGSEVSRTSRTIGVSVSDLQSLRGAAQATGLSSEDLTSGMKSLGDTLQDALYGRNQDALAVLNKLGISIKKTSSGAVDSVQAFRDLSVAISHIKSPQVQGLVARTFGVEALLPLLREGPAAMAKYQQRVAALGAVMGPEQIRRAESFGLALNYLSVAGQGLRNTIGDALIPAFQPLIESLTKWISANRELIGQEVGRWAREFADWVKGIDFKELWAGLQKTIKGIADFVEFIGGWKVAAIGVALVMAGPLLLSITNVALGVGGLLLKLPLLIAGLNGVATASAGANVAGVGLLGTLGKLGAAGVAAYTALQIARAAGLPDTDKAKGLQSVKEGNWLAASAQLPALDFASEVWKRLTGGGQGGSSQSGVGDSLGAVNFFRSKGWSYEQALGIAANLKKESNFDNRAVGDRGQAYGIAQWHRDRQREFEKWAGKKIQGSSLEEQMGFVNFELTQGKEKAAGDALRKATNEQQAASIVSRQYERPANADGEAAGRARAATDMKQQLEIHLKGLPAGTTATARDSAGKNVPVNVATSMAGP